MGEVILLPALDKGGQAALPQFGGGSPQHQLVQAGQGPFPLGRNSQAREPPRDSSSRGLRLLAPAVAADADLGVLPRMGRRGGRCAGW